MKRILTLLILLLMWNPLILRGQHVTVYNDTVCDTEDYGVLRTNIQSLMTNAYVTDTLTYNFDANFANANDILQGGVPLAIDDEFSDVIDIGFTFYFFGEPYTQLVVGSNGDIIFEPSVAGTYDSWPIYSYQLIPNIELPYYDNGISYGSIMGAYHDIDAGRRIQGLSEMKYELRGTAPNRKFIITYYEMPQFSCNNMLTSQQIVLNESDYSIEVHMRNKPVCSNWNNGLAVLGIQNADATCGYYPGDGTTPGSMTVNRNTGVWSIDSLLNPEAWIFRPANSTATMSITWYDSNRNPVPGAHADSLVVPLNGDLGPYTCEVTYYDCQGNHITEYDEGEVVVVPTPVLNLGDPVQKRCSNETITLDATPENIDQFQNVNLVYEWSKDGNVIPGATSPQLEVNEPGVYSVVVSSGNCSAEAEVTVENYRNEACIIPEVITPDGDGKNDALVLDYLNEKQGISKIQIFNRWGSEVFSKTDGYTDEWHGQNKNDKDLPTATYFYVIELKNGDTKKGMVYIIR